MITTTVNIDDKLDQKYNNLFTLADIIINKITSEEFKNVDGIPNNSTISGLLSASDEQLETNKTILNSLNDNQIYFTFQLDATDNEKLSGDEIDNTRYEITGATVKEIVKLLTAKEDYQGLFTTETIEGVPVLTNNIEINSLAEYFGVLGILKNIHPRFIRLPVDEDYYFINANDRTINPGTKAPRFAVKGDNVAEILYFKIDRYYDATDLADTTILVLSQIGDKKYVSPIQLIDLDSEPGYIVFGWPIGTILTATSGTLNFAIRFYVPGAGIEYSLGTLTQSLTIRDSLSWLTGDGITKDNSKPYIKNFKIDGTAVIEKPVFLESDNNLSPESNVYYNTDSLLRAKATSNAGTKIKYEWKIDKRKQELITMDSLTDTEKVFKKETVTPNTDIPSDSIYYKKIIPENGTETVRAVQFEKVTSGKFETGVEYYTLQDRLPDNEEPSVFQPTEPGDYYCIATAENGIGIEKKALGPYRVKGPAVYDFVTTGDLNPLSYNAFIIPAGKTFNDVSLTDYIDPISSYITRTTNKGAYIGMPQDQLVNGSFNIVEVPASKDETLQDDEKNFAVQNTVNGASSIGNSIKKKFYDPIPTDFTASGTYEDDGNNLIYKTDNITVTFNEGMTDPETYSDLFTKTCVWQQKNALNWENISGIGDTFSIKKSDLNNGNLAQGIYRINIIYTFNNQTTGNNRITIYHQGETPVISTTIDLADFSKKVTSSP